MSPPIKPLKPVKLAIINRSNYKRRQTIGSMFYDFAKFGENIVRIGRLRPISPTLGETKFEIPVRIEKI